MEDHFTQVFNELKGVDLWLSDAPALGRNGSYGAFMYAQHLVDALAAHDYSSPVFIYAAWQNTHSPLQVPNSYLDPLIDTEVKGGATKQSYFGMTKCMDECVRNVTEAHKAHGGAAAWANTLVIFSADNGGETFAGGNNCACPTCQFLRSSGTGATVGLMCMQTRGAEGSTLILKAAREWRRSSLEDWFRLLSEEPSPTLRCISATGSVRSA